MAPPTVSGFIEACAVGGVEEMCDVGCEAGFDDGGDDSANRCDETH
jgi:hypothetical protein